MTTQHKPGEIPEIIYLQWYGDEDPECLTNAEKARIDPNDGSVSWCWEQIFPSDIQYVRKDKYAELLAYIKDRGHAYHCAIVTVRTDTCDCGFSEAIAKAGAQ